jgi:hypothetical protein
MFGIAWESVMRVAAVKNLCEDEPVLFLHASKVGYLFLIRGASIKKQSEAETKKSFIVLTLSSKGMGGS